MQKDKSLLSGAGSESDSIDLIDELNGKFVESKTKDYNQFKEKCYKIYDYVEEKESEKSKAIEFKRALTEGKINTKVRCQKQSEHLAGTKGRERRIEDDLKNRKTCSSEFYKNVDVGRLIQEHIGNGEFVWTEKREYPIEYISANKAVGIVWNCEKNKYVETERFAIVYSRKGVHAYPVKRKKEESNG